MKRLPAAILIVALLAPFVARAEPARESINGREGYWRIGEDRAGVWWFVGPDGRREFLNCVTTVIPRLAGRDAAGPHFASCDWDGKSSEGAGLDHWAEATIARVTAAGFKGLGAWCDPVFHKYDVPITRDLNLSTWLDADARRVFSPKWEAAIEQTVRRQVTPLRDNRNLVGYYLDNELDWSDAVAGPAAYFNASPLRDPNRLEVVRVMRSLWPDLDQMNRAWGTRASTWDEVTLWATLPQSPPQRAAYRRLYSAWLSRVARRYFEVTTHCVRRYDPNHLVLGIRFRGYAPAEVVEASRGLTDAQSVNYYPNDAMLDRTLFQTLHERSGGQPVIVSEYAFHALDGRSGNRNTFGFPAQVANQTARAAGYRDMTTRLARLPYVIGADWFQWMDEPPSGRVRDGEDVNFGVVDVKDRPYELLVEAVRQTTPTLNGLHGRSASEGYADVWRDGRNRDVVVDSGQEVLVGTEK